MSNYAKPMRGSVIRTGRSYLGFTQRRFLRELHQFKFWSFSQPQLSRVENDADNSVEEHILRSTASEYLRSRGIEDDAADNMILIR